MIVVVVDVENLFSFYLALALVISCWLRWTVSSWVILAISPMSTWRNKILFTQAGQHVPHVHLVQ